MAKYEHENQFPEEKGFDEPRKAMPKGVSDEWESKFKDNYAKELKRLVDKIDPTKLEGETDMDLDGQYFAAIRKARRQAFSAAQKATDSQVGKTKEATSNEQDMNDYTEVFKLRHSVPEVLQGRFLESFEKEYKQKMIDSIGDPKDAKSMKEYQSKVDQYSERVQEETASSIIDGLQKGKLPKGFKGDKNIDEGEVKKAKKETHQHDQDPDRKYYD